MIAQEIHLGIDLDLQKINSQATKNLLPQEKDWFLNREVIKFIKQRYSEQSNSKGTGFQDTFKRIEDLKGLVKSKPCAIEVDNKGQEYITLPFDYLYPVRFDALLRKKCTKVNPSEITNKYSNAFKIVLPTEGTLSSFSITMLKDGVNTTLFDIVDLPDSYIVTEEFRKQKFLLLKALQIKLLSSLQEVLSPDIELYWETIGDSYTPNTYTLISNIEFTSITVNSVSGGTSNITTNTVTSPLAEYSEEVSFFTRQMRVVGEEQYGNILNSGLSQPTIQSPVVKILKGIGKLAPIAKGAIYKEVNVTYICQPTLIDLLLDSTVQLEDYAIEEIISNTVRFIKSVIQDNNYQTYAQENILIE